MFEKKITCLCCWKEKKEYRSGHCKDCFEKKTRTAGMMTASPPKPKMKGRIYKHKSSKSKTGRYRYGD